MADTAASPSRLQKLKDPRVLGRLALAAVAGLLLGMAGDRVFFESGRRVNALKLRAHGAMVKLIRLQNGFKKSHGRYAADLETLLASSPDGTALKTELAATVDMNTLVVKGGPKAFKLEANILDEKRSAFKYKGP